MRRTWFKCYADSLINGTTSTELEDPAERWVWIGLLCMATTSPCEGEICIGPEIGYTDEQLAGVLKVSLALFQSAKEKCIRFGKIEIKGDIIQITNWARYQSDYQRQKKYRAPLKKESQPPLSSSSSGSLREEQKRKEKRKICNSKLHAKVTRKGYNRKLQAKVTTPPTPGDIEKEFAAFWDIYPEDRGDRDQALKAYEKLRQTESLEMIEKALEGYLGYLKHKRTKKGFEQAPMFASNFLSFNHWKEHLDFKYEPPQ